MLHSSIPTASLKISSKCHCSTKVIVTLFLKKSSEFWCYFPVSLEKVVLYVLWEFRSLQFIVLMFENKLIGSQDAVVEKHFFAIFT